MPSSLISSLWELPGPRQFLQKIGQDLLDGVSQIILYPPGVNSYGIKHELLRSIERDHFLDVRLINAIGDGEGNLGDPFLILCQEFPEAAEYGFLERVIEEYALPDVILVENLENCQKEMQTAWMQTLKRWIQATQASGVRHSLLLLLPADAAVRFILPPPDVRLSYLVWAGIPTSLEVRLLCRMKTEGLDFEDQWREFMIASLAANDIGLCEHLWDVITCSKEEIIAELHCFAGEQGWDGEHLHELLRGWKPRPPGLDLRLNPQESGFSLLSQGITVYTAEYGEEINSAALAAMGKVEEIEHRIWRAQAALLLPLIDEVRRRICTHMTANYGDNWAEIERQIYQPPLEWGKLKIFFESLSRQFPEKDRWGTGVKQTWWIRNQLSHYNCIQYNNFRDFWNLSISVRRNSFNRTGIR